MRFRSWNFFSLEEGFTFNAYMEQKGKFDGVTYIKVLCLKKMRIVGRNSAYLI